MEVPDKAVILMSVTGLAWVWINGTWISWALSLLFAAIFFVMWLAGGMGGGDVKLSFALAFWLDPKTYAYVLIFSCLAAFIWGIYRLAKRGEMLAWAACFRSGAWGKLPEDDPRGHATAVPLAAFIGICAGLAVACNALGFV